IVAGKQFVAAVAGERHSHMLARHCRYEISGYLRRVGERFVIDIGQTRNEIESLARSDCKFGMISMEMTGHRRCMRRLIVTWNVEADRKCPYSTQMRLLHQGDHCRGVDAPRQKRTERDVRDHAPRHGILQQRLELLGQLSVVPVELVKN